MITHLGPDILECEVKRALETITRNKASGGDGIPVELFHILKDDVVKVLHSICQEICNSSMTTGLEKVSFQSNHKEIKCQRILETTIQLYSTHMLARLCSISFKLGFSST